MHDPLVRRWPPASRRGPKQGTLIGQGRAGQRAARSLASVRVPCSHHDAGWVFGGFQYPSPPVHADLALKERAIARTAPQDTPPGRYQAPDLLLAFLDQL